MVEATRPIMKHFKVEQEGAVQTWTMSNPPMNYMTAAMTGASIRTKWEIAECR